MKPARDSADRLTIERVRTLTSELVRMGLAAPGAMVQLGAAARFAGRAVLQGFRSRAAELWIRFSERGGL